MTGALQDRGTFRGIAATLLALSLVAERAAGRAFPVRFLVLAILNRAEAVARAFVARATGTDCLDEPSARHYGAADAQLLALRLRMLAAILGALADAEGDYDDRSAERSAAHSRTWSARAVAPHLPLLLLVRLPAARRPSRPP